MFSYGSGSVASMYSFVGRSSSSSSFSIGRIQETVDIFTRLDARKRCTYDEFVSSLNLRETSFGKASIVPVGSLDNLTKGTFYLKSINDKYHRSYGQY